MKSFSFFFLSLFLFTTAAMAKVDFSKNALQEPAMYTRWSALTPDVIAPAVEAGIQKAQIALDRIRNQDPQEATFENTFLALEESTKLLERVWKRVSHWERVSSPEGLAAAFREANPRVTEFLGTLYTDEALWKQIQAVYESPEAQSLNPQEKRLMDKILTLFRAQGAQLSEERKKEFLSLQKRLTELTQTFAENSQKDHDNWELYIGASKEELEANEGIPTCLRGIPQGVLDTCKAQALERGKGTPESPQWRLCLDQPIYMPIMCYAKDDSVRKAVWEGSQQIGRSAQHNNLELIPQIVNLRQKKAQLLGYKNFADWVLQTRMAQTGAQALAFVEDLHQRTAPYFQAEVKTLEAFKGQLQGNKDPQPINPWELGFLEFLHVETYNDFNSEELRPYFEISRVKGGLFDISHRLFGVTVKPLPTRYKNEGPSRGIDVWHPDVEAYELFDENSRFVGIFYMDLFPRKGKRAGAWMDDLVAGGMDRSGRWQHPVGVVCGNMTPPTGDGTPVLLSHDEVVTLFHEFGHLLHSMLGRVPLKGLNGTNVAWDFVEAPSQLMENFCWEPESLNLFAKNYKTDEKIPCTLQEKLLKRRKVFQGLSLMRQLSLSKMDLDLHIHGSPEAQKLDAHLGNLLKDYLPEYATPALSIICKFHHLFNSDMAMETYAAGYYGYQWAEVLDADLFTRFKQADVLSAQVGRAFVETILTQGDSEAPEILFERFMGRPKRLDAFLQRIGFETKATAGLN